MRTILLMTTALTAALTATPAFAQEAPATEEADNGGEIVVRARQREERLVDVPVAVSVATQEQLERDQVYNITDLQRVAPALEVSQTSGGENNGGARLRGLGTGVFNASVSPSVAFVVDQVPQGNLSFPLLYDLAQVEVLRGPQGTLFGQGASAGVVNVTTVNPTTDGFHVNGGIDYADKGTGGSEVGETVVRAGLNIPMGDSAALRVAGQYKQEKGLQRNTFLGLDNKIQEYGIRAKVLLEPASNFTVNISAEYSQSQSDGWNFFAIALAPNGQPVSTASLGAFTSPTGCNIPVINDRAEFYCEDTQTQLATYAGGASVRIDWGIADNMTLTSVTAYREIDRETATVNFSRRIGVAARTENQQTNADQFSQELRLAYSGEGVDVLVGALYSRFNLETVPLDTNVTFGSRAFGTRTGFSVCHNTLTFICPVAPSLTYEDTQNTNKSIFADATFSITDQIDIFGGLRYNDYSNTTGVGSLGAGAVAVTASRTSTIEDTDISGRIGISFKPSPDSTIFASYARGYKPPAIVVPTISTQAVTNLEPEKADAFELGAKFDLGGLQLSGNIFHTNVKNFQIQNSVIDSNSGSLVSVTQNISSVKSKGFELNAFGQLTDNFSINAGYQYNDVQYPNGFLGDDNIALGGKQFLNAPKHKVTLSADASFPMGGLEFFVGANVVYKTKVLLAQRGNPIYTYPAHELVNGRLGIRDAEGTWTASLWVRNLTKEREPTAYLASDLGGSPDGGVRAWPVAGLTARVVGVSLGFDF